MRVHMPSQSGDARPVPAPKLSEPALVMSYWLKRMSPDMAVTSGSPRHTGAACGRPVASTAQRPATTEIGVGQDCAGSTTLLPPPVYSHAFSSTRCGLAPLDANSSVPPTATTQLLDAGHSTCGTTVLRMPLPVS